MGAQAWLPEKLFNIFVMAPLLSITNLGASPGSASALPLRLQPVSITSLRRSSSCPSILRKDASTSRAQSVAALVLAGPQQKTLVATVGMTILLATDYDVKVDAQVDGSRPEPSDFPEVCLAGSTHRITFVTAFLETRVRASRAGAVKIDGFVPVEFHLARGRGTPHLWGLRDCRAGQLSSKPRFLS